MRIRNGCRSTRFFRLLFKKPFVILAAVLLFGLITTLVTNMRMPHTVGHGAQRVRKNFEAKEPVPKIVHYTWYGKDRRTFRFHHYISVLSALKFIKPQKIMFWHELLPKGAYWDEIRLKINETSKLEMMQRIGPIAIFGNRVRADEHKSDIVRLEVLLKYGGIYSDLDVIVLKPLENLLKHDTTMGYEMHGWLGNGFIMSKANAPFLKLWYKQYSYFNDSYWNFHSVQVPGILAQNHRTLLHTEWDTINRPNWRETDKIYGTGVRYDWSRNYAMHLWYRRYGKDHDNEDIKTLDSTLGEVFRYIVYGTKEIIDYKIG